MCRIKAGDDFLFNIRPHRKILFFLCDDFNLTPKLMLTNMIMCLGLHISQSSTAMHRDIHWLLFGLLTKLVLRFHHNSGVTPKPFPLTLH